jgi:hypothetical protein
MRTLQENINLLRAFEENINLLRTFEKNINLLCKFLEKYCVTNLRMKGRKYCKNSTIISSREENKL